MFTYVFIRLVSPNAGPVTADVAEPAVGQLPLAPVDATTLRVGPEPAQACADSVISPVADP